MNRTTKPKKEKPDRRQVAGTAKPGIGNPPTYDDQLEKRIERLEQRLEESLIDDDGLAAAGSGLDRSESGDALERAVSRSNRKRGSRKA
jgi:hypothetical protein